MSSVVIIIPIYKEKMSICEKISLCQLYKVLGTYTICFVAPKRMKNFFSDICVNVEYFENKNFSSIYEYSELLMKKFFYEKFLQYDYMLIYQLDVFVFSDRLKKFLDMDYDYIGAPMPYSKLEGVGGRIGNGGFSLRKIKSCIEVTKHAEEIFPKVFKNIPNGFMRPEDKFFGYCGAHNLYSFKVPSVKIALDFGIEYDVAHCYQNLDKQLPFGCHAWSKYRYFNLWRKYIEAEGYCLDEAWDEVQQQSHITCEQIHHNDIVNYIKKRVKRMKNNFFYRVLEKVVNKKNHIVLWGGGNIGIRCLELLEGANYTIDYIIDNSKKNINSKGRIPVINFEQYIQQNHNALVVVASTKYENEMVNELKLNKHKNYMTFKRVEELFCKEYVNLLLKG